MPSKFLPLTACVAFLVLDAAQGEERPSAELVGVPVDGVGIELTSLAFDRDETLWIGSRYWGIYAYRHGRFFLYNAYTAPIPDEGISAIFVDPNNTKWFGSERGYLYSFDGKQWQVFTASKVPRDSIGTIRCIRSDGKGGVWFTADYGSTGLFRVEKGKIESISPNVKSGADERGYQRRRLPSLRHGTQHGCRPPRTSLGRVPLGLSLLRRPGLDPARRQPDTANGDLQALV